MIGRYVSVWCRLFGHGEPLWCVREAGVGFVCPDCQRFRVSPVLRSVLTNTAETRTPARRRA